jgi:hypothetical protein
LMQVSKFFNLCIDPKNKLRPQVKKINNLNLV